MHAYSKSRAQAAIRATVSTLFFFPNLGLLTDDVPQGIGAAQGLLEQNGAGGGVKGLRMPLPVGARVHPPSQNAPERGHVCGGGDGVRRSPATGSRRAGEIAEAVAALGHRADLRARAPGEGGAGGGILHWC